VIYNSFVLEHIEDASQVLQNSTRWLKPGGIVVLKIPDPDSVCGFITRVTPHWFHVFYYRYLLGARNAGKPGYAPYTIDYRSSPVAGFENSARNNRW
ncbi:MAG: methyltransferase domain-containing protein, partial [Pyrinomonadaceae bacterium]